MIILLIKIEIIFSYSITPTDFREASLFNIGNYEPTNDFSVIEIIINDLKMHDFFLSCVFKNKKHKSNVSSLLGCIEPLYSPGGLLIWLVKPRNL